jgi:DNA (cytosine-5)-methyltransferase 1
VRYLSVCSGIEAASVAWESLGWTPVAFAEIEKFPSKVLAHHYPGVANLGDMTKFREWDIERNAVDVLVGGTPCQSFSVAGLRKGLDDPRGNLALTFVAMVDHYRPEWVIWENVPGVLSSSGGRDFGSFLGALGQLGYGFAYRVLDAQYFGVPQRRRRVFVVAHSSGDSRRAAEVLFEPESLRGDSTKSNRKGEKSTSSPASSVDANGIQRTVMYENHPNDSRITGPVDPSPTVAARWGTGGGNTPLVQHTFRKSRRAQSAEDFETWVPDGVTNTLNCFDLGDIRSVDIVVEPIALAENTIGRQPLNGGNGDGYTVGGPMYTLNATGVHGVAYTFNPSNIRLGNNVELSNVTQTLLSSQAKNGDNQPLVLTAHAFEPGSVARNAGPSGISNLCPTLRANMGDNQPAVLLHPAHAFKIRGVGHYTGTNGGVAKPGTGGSGYMGQDEKAYTIATSQDQQIMHGMAVRRLTPTECERLQGFPDGYTDIMPETPDGPRYKALGNSMAVPVMRWIGSRIALATK